MLIAYPKTAPIIYLIRHGEKMAFQQKATSALKVSAMYLVQIALMISGT